MKLNPFLSIIAIFMAALLSYFEYWLAPEDDPNIKVFIGSTIVCFLTTLFIGLGCSMENVGKNVNIKITSVIFLIIFLIEHCAFAYLGINKEPMIITSGLLLLFFLTAIYLFFKMKM